MNEKILIAEDDPAILAGVADLLKLEGYDVLEAANGAIAIELFKKSPPDLVLMDVMMPLVNGYDVCREIRRSDEITPILMLTAKGEEVDKVIGLGLGADDYIVKPFGIAELTARIRSALRRVSLVKKTSSDAEKTELIMGDAVVNFERMTVQKGKEPPAQLTPKEP